MNLHVTKLNGGVFFKGGHWSVLGYVLMYRVTNPIVVLNKPINVL